MSFTYCLCSVQPPKQPEKGQRNPLMSSWSSILLYKCQFHPLTIHPFTMITLITYDKRDTLCHRKDDRCGRNKRFRSQIGGQAKKPSPSSQWNCAYRMPMKEGVRHRTLARGSTQLNSFGLPTTQHCKFITEMLRKLLLGMNLFH